MAESTVRAGKPKIDPDLRILAAAARGVWARPGAVMRSGIPGNPISSLSSHHNGLSSRTWRR
jgi:hypothetical protein